RRFGRPRSRSGLSVFQGAGQSSPSDTFQYSKRSGCVTLLRNEFEVLEVGLTHSRGYGTVPIGVIVAKHAVNDVLGMLVKCLRFCNAAAACFQVSQDCQVPRHVIAITDPLARSEALCRTGVCSGEISGVSIKSRQFEHGVSFHSVEPDPCCELPRILQIGNSLLFVSVLLRQLA